MTHNTGNLLDVQKIQLFTSTKPEHSFFETQLNTTWREHYNEAMLYAGTKLYFPDYQGKYKDIFQQLITMTHEHYALLHYLIRTEEYTPEWHSENEKIAAYIEKGASYWAERFKEFSAPEYKELRYMIYAHIYVNNDIFLELYKDLSCFDFASQELKEEYDEWLKTMGEPYFNIFRRGIIGLENRPRDCYTLAEMLGLDFPLTRESYRQRYNLVSFRLKFDTLLSNDIKKQLSHAYGMSDKLWAMYDELETKCNELENEHKEIKTKYNELENKNKRLRGLIEQAEQAKIETSKTVDEESKKSEQEPAKPHKEMVHTLASVLDEVIAESAKKEVNDDKKIIKNDVEFDFNNLF